MIAGLTPARSAISLVVAPLNPICENSSEATSTICRRRSSARIRGETDFAPAIKFGLSLIEVSKQSLTVYSIKRKSEVTGEQIRIRVESGYEVYERRAP